MLTVNADDLRRELLDGCLGVPQLLPWKDQKSGGGMGNREFLIMEAVGR